MNTQKNNFSIITGSNGQDARVLAGILNRNEVKVLALTRKKIQADYENIAYRMPAQFGSVKRVSVQKDPDSLKRNLNMYVVSEDSNGKLAKTNSTIKNNLKTWVDNYRMINDTVDILDPYIINIGICENKVKKNPAKPF